MKTIPSLLQDLERWKSGLHFAPNSLSWLMLVSFSRLSLLTSAPKLQTVQLQASWLAHRCRCQLIRAAWTELGSICLQVSQSLN